MIQLFHPLLTLIATASDSLLTKYVLYLKNENWILRDRIPGELNTKPPERAQLLKYGQPLGKAINELITIVTPGPFIAGYAKRNKGGRESSLVDQERVPYCENWFSRSPGKRGSAMGLNGRQSFCTRRSCAQCVHQLCTRMFIKSRKKQR